MNSILIADDHPIVRSGLKQVLNSDADIAEVHETDNGESALQLIRQLHPSLAVLDVEMPRMDGLAVAEIVQREELPTHIVIMTMHDDENTLNRAMSNGVKGFVSKETGVTDILNAVKTVLNGKHYFSPTLVPLLIRRNRNTEPTTPNKLDALTETEQKILSRIADQKTTNAIAAELFMSPKTVEKHRSNICQKLGLRGAYALLKFALQMEKS
jgi:DNA-binding NarL/FixJ family response regulator